MSSEPIRLGFAGFWPGFDPHDNFFTRLLRTHFAIEICSRPDYLIHSCVGPGRDDHLRHAGIRIFYTGENVAPDWSNTDWAFGFSRDPHPRHFRLPLWVLSVDPLALIKPAEYEAEVVLCRKRRFCAFVVSNAMCRTRNAFFKKLSRYRPVDSGGAVFNNIGHRVIDKRPFLSEYKFVIAFENESAPGYCTEKLVEPMLTGTIPLYWGDPEVGQDFDTRSFLCAHDGRSLEDLVDRVVVADRDPLVHLEMLRRPWYRDNAVPSCASMEAILRQFERIFTEPIETVARHRGLVRSPAFHRLPARFCQASRLLSTRVRRLMPPR